MAGIINRLEQLMGQLDACPQSDQAQLTRIVGDIKTLLAHGQMNGDDKLENMQVLDSLIFIS